MTHRTHRILVALLAALTLGAALGVAPASAQTARAAGPLRARVIVNHAPRFDPRFADPATVRRIEAMEDPSTARFVPDPRPSLEDRLFRRFQQQGRSSITPDVARRYQAEARAREAAEQAAAARYQSEFGDLPRTFHVAPPTVDLTLRIENPTAHPVSLRTDGDSTTLRMRLRGPGAHHALGGGDTNELFHVGRLATIPAHGHLDIPIHSLVYGDRAHEVAAYWTQPGAYTLEVAFDTVVDARGGTEPSTPVRLRAAPITLRVR